VFETLEPPEQIVARRWPLLMYSTYGLGGLVFAILGVQAWLLAARQSCDCLRDVFSVPDVVSNNPEIRVFSA
jgi:hypothetical protein